MRVVWVSSWEMECCGDPFEVGRRVRWTAAPIDPSEDAPWFSDVLGDEIAATLTDCEDRHGQSDAARTIEGVVRSVRGVACEWRDGGDGSMVPVRGTTMIAELTSVDRARAMSSGFVGYLVEVE